MEISFRYPFASPCEVPDGQVMGVYGPAQVPEDEVGDEQKILADALAQPIGTMPLGDQVESGQKVTIIVDDMTRTTPNAQLLDALSSELARGGVAREDVTILLALGTHRDMTSDEIRAHLGDPIVSQYRVINHHARVTHELTHCGATIRGTDAIVNRVAAESDFLVGCGHLVPHRIAGFSGGGKIVLPGVASHQSIGQIHWLSAQFPNDKINGVRNNPVRTEIDGVAELAGLQFVLNIVQDFSGRIVHAVAGHPVKAHREGAFHASRIYRVEMPEPADIVLADSYPSDLDMWQAVKALFACGLAVKPGGTIILVSPCPEGVAQTHPAVLEYGYKRWHEVAERAHDDEFPDMVAAAHIVEGGEILDRARVILVSEGIDSATAASLGTDWASSPQEAVDKALADTGGSASVAVLVQAGELAPVTQKVF